MFVTLMERYNVDWPLQFETLRARLMGKLEDHILSIEHVGSTSVSGMTAKPIIDLDIVIPDGTLERTIDLMATLGYFHQGDLGIPTRDAFDLSDPVPEIEPAQTPPLRLPRIQPRTETPSCFSKFPPSEP